MPYFGYNNSIQPQWSGQDYKLVYPGQEDASGNPGYADPFAPTEEVPAVHGAGQIPTVQQRPAAIRRGAGYLQPANGQVKPDLVQATYPPKAPEWPVATEAPRDPRRPGVLRRLGRLAIIAGLVVSVGGGIVGGYIAGTHNTGPRTANTPLQPMPSRGSDQAHASATPHASVTPHATPTHTPVPPKNPTTPPTPNDNPKGVQPEYLPSSAHVYSSPGGNELDASNDIPAGATVYVACSIKVNGVEWYQLSDTGNWVPASAFANKNDTGLPTCP